MVALDLYSTSLLVGAAGLGVMALGGIGARGGHGGSGHAVAHTHAGTPGLHAHHGVHHGLQHAAQRGMQRGIQAARSANPVRSTASRAFWTITSPRFLFSALLGFGTTGELLHSVLGGPLLFVAALAGAVAFERAIVTPLWNFSMRFASAPAATLESAVTDEATAVTAFDVNGQGIVCLEVDGQVVQVLATLQSADRDLGVRVRAGQRVRIEDVNAANNRCTVSLL